MSNVRWGLLSTANINRRLIPAIRSATRGELVAIASRSQESADAYAAHWDIPRAFGSYDAMLQSDNVDAVYIPLPNHLHAEWSIKAMEAGKHVLCEKPFALSLDEAERMRATAKDTGRVLAEAFMYRHHPQTKLVGEWVRGGRLGEITLIQGVFNFKMWETNNIRLVREYGGGSLWDLGVYPVSLAQYVMGGPPARVSGSQQLTEGGVDDFFAGLLLYAGGGVAQISSSFRTPFHTSAEIIGTEGRLILTRPFVALEQGRRLIFQPAGGEAQDIPVPEEYLYLGEVEDMHAAILDGEPSYLTLDETYDHVRTVLALYESAGLGKSVVL